MAELIKMPIENTFDPQEAFNNIVISVANQIAEKTLEAIEERDTSLWLSQKELVNKKGFSRQYIKQMENYGLQSRKQGKEKMYCLADVNEVLHLMKETN